MRGVRQHLYGSLRVAAFLAVVAAVLLYVDYRAARASVFERILGVTQRMVPYLDDPRTTEAPRSVHVNGARFHVAAGHTAHPPEQVRKFYRDRYRGKDGGLSALADDLKRRGAAVPALPGDGFEFGDAQRGGVAALDWGDGKQGLPELATRLKRLVATGDLGELARLRYCYTERDEQGGTRFLTVWTDERFNLHQLLPPAGGQDAPGFDLDGVPRYPGSVRTLSMDESGVTQRMSVYESLVGSPEAASLFYRGHMKTLGWTEETTFSDLAANESKVGLHFLRDGHEVFLTLSDRQGGQGLSVVAMQTR
jgi:hypothetical protein